MKAPKETHQILVNRYVLYGFSVDAASPEEACKILARELRSGELKRARGGEPVIDAYWANPADKGDAWAVTCRSRHSGDSEPPVMAWNGTRVVKCSGLSAPPEN